MDDLTAPIDPEDDLFSFETDHLALKGNEDYCEVLKTLVILSAQREKALKDYKKIAELKVEALRNPFETLEKLRDGEDLGVPPLMELPKLPKIDFQKYKVAVPENELTQIYSEGGQTNEEKPIIKNPNPINTRAWTPEEQKRLEELLLVYPPEPIEARRMQKIAKALGNRTVQQVASRLQKYFLKLYQAGLPIPGRIPKSAEKHKKSSLHKHQRHNHYFWKPTTFFPELNVPVVMDDLNNIPGPSEVNVPSTVNPTSENYLIKTKYHTESTSTATTKSDQELQLELLKRVREVKLEEQSQDYLPFSHVGFKCDYCDDSPIIATRWHCTVCPDSVDFCTDCVVSQIYSEGAHPLNHWLSTHRDDSQGNASVFDAFVPPPTQYEKQIAEEVRVKMEISDNDEGLSDDE